MIGKYQLEIGLKSDGRNDFLEGMALSAASTDGGFSSQTDACNLSSVPGVLYAPATPTNGDSDAILVGNVIASCEDPVNGNNRLFVAYPSGSGNGTYYAYNGSKLVLKVTDSTNTRTSDSLVGSANMIAFNGKYYTTLNNEITEWDGAATIDVDWWTTAKSKTLVTGYRHPMVVFNNRLYIGDRNRLWSVDYTTVGNGAEGTPVEILTLDGYVDITALGIDPGSGKMLVGFSSQANASGTLAAEYFIGLYDGFNPTQFVKKIGVDDMVTCFHLTEGTVYVTYGNRFGYFTGSGIEFLWKFQFPLDNTRLAYKNHVTNIGNTIYIIDGTQIFAFGKINTEKRVRRHIFKNQTNAKNLGLITNVGNGVLGIGIYATDTTYAFVLLSTTSVASNNSIDFYSKRYSFPRPIFIRTAFVEYDTQITNNQNPGTIYSIDDTGTSTALGNLTAVGTQGVLSMSARDIKTRTLQVRYTGSTIATGVRRIVFMYDIAE